MLDALKPSATRANALEKLYETLGMKTRPPEPGHHFSSSDTAKGWTNWKETLLKFKEMEEAGSIHTHHPVIIVPMYNFLLGHSSQAHFFHHHTRCCWVF